MQVVPFKPTLKAPGYNRLKLEYDELLSNFAFKINMRHNSKGTTRTCSRLPPPTPRRPPPAPTPRTPPLPLPPLTNKPPPLRRWAAPPPDLASTVRLGLPHAARHVVGSHFYLNKRGFKCVWMTWQALCGRPYREVFYASVPEVRPASCFPPSHPHAFFNCFYVHRAPRRFTW